MRQFIFMAVAGVLMCVLAAGMYACGMPGIVVWLLSLTGLLLFLLTNALVAGIVMTEIRNIEREISRHYKERGW